MDSQIGDLKKKQTIDTVRAGSGPAIVTASKTSQWWALIWAYVYSLFHIYLSVNHYIKQEAHHEMRQRTLTFLWWHCARTTNTKYRTCCPGVMISLIAKHRFKEEIASVTQLLWDKRKKRLF